MVRVPTRDLSVGSIDAETHPIGPRRIKSATICGAWGHDLPSATLYDGRWLNQERNMTKGISLHIGLNFVDPDHYDGWSGKLNACVADAEAMDAIASGRGFATHRLTNQGATRDALRAKLRAFAQEMVAGDLLLLTYSGHGGQVGDYSRDEQDGIDETWCLYDGQILDDELYQLYGAFKEGVRIAVFSDSCHSGTVTRDPVAAATEIPEGARAMPPDVAARVYNKHRAFYDGLQQAIPKDVETAVKASVLLISGCQDAQTSLDGTFNGAFTEALLRVWDNGKFGENYHKFHEAIVTRMPKTQRPNFFEVGIGSFAKHKPFTI
jgi:metacaspase-1